MQNSMRNSVTKPSPDPNRYRRRCPDPNARIHYMAIAGFAIAGCQALKDTSWSVHQVKGQSHQAKLSTR